MSDKPTKRGLEKFPSTNGFFTDYYPDGSFDLVACTCLASCDRICSGKKCKCEACKTEYNDYLSCDFD